MRYRGSQGPPGEPKIHSGGGGVIASQLALFRDQRDQKWWGAATHGVGRHRAESRFFPVNSQPLFPMDATA